MRSGTICVHAGFIVDVLGQDDVTLAAHGEARLSLCISVFGR
jgi:hypothetical protein